MPLDSKNKRVIEIGALIIVAGIMAILVSVGLNVFLAGSSSPQVAVTTGSMLPIYNGYQDNDGLPIYPFRGDILLVRKVSPENIKIGDVIVFQRSNDSSDIPVVHRVIAKWEVNGEFVFKTNGDNNVIPDYWKVYGQNIKGVVVFRIPHIGWFLIVVQSTAGRIVILAIAIIILFYGEEEEDKNEEEKSSNLEKKNTSKEHRINNRLFALFRPRLMYSFLITLIFTVFMFSNVFSAFSSPPNISLYTINDDSFKHNLLSSDNDSPTIMSTRYSWVEDTSNLTTFFYPIRIKINSGGLFNNIHRLDIAIDENKGLYSWNTVYNYIGVKIIEGGIIGYFATSGSNNVTISITLTCRGLLASPTRTYSFPLILQT
ncbi:MAG: signal peptidase I [Candidatus Hodarchaeales archaeon]